MVTPWRNHTHFSSLPSSLPLPLSSLNSRLMIIGIDCSRYALPNPTGVELYTNHIVDGIIEHAQKFKDHELRLYVRTTEQKQKLEHKLNTTNLSPLRDLRSLGEVGSRREGATIVTEEGSGHKQNSNLKITHVKGNHFWTVYHLSKQLLFSKIDLLFVPSHTFPLWMPKRSLITIHGIEAFQIPDAYTKKQLAEQIRHVKRATKKATKIIAVSQTVKDNLIKYTKASPDQIEVVYNGFTKETPPPPEVGSVLCPEPQKGLIADQTINNKPYIFSLGRLEKRKNQLRLIQAFEKIADDFPDLQLILAGPITNQSKKILSHIKTSHLSHRITTLGHTPPEQVVKLMRNAELFAFPSLSEGFGIPILEAMNAGTPVLTSKDSGCDEIAGDGAIHVDPYNIDEIAKGLTKLLTDKERYQTLIQKGKMRARQFSWKKCAEQTIKTLLSITK